MSGYALFKDRSVSQGYSRVGGELYIVSSQRCPLLNVSVTPSHYEWKQYYIKFSTLFNLPFYLNIWSVLNFLSLFGSNRIKLSTSEREKNEGGRYDQRMDRKMIEKIRSWILQGVKNEYVNKERWKGEKNKNNRIKKYTE